MKKYIYLFSVSLALSGFLFFAYFQSHNSLTTQRQEVLDTLSSIRQIDSGLDKNILRAHNSLIWNYDSLARSEQELNQACEKLKGAGLKLYRSSSSELDTAIDSYCAVVSDKISDVERFKTSNSILRNSVFYLHDVSAHENLKTIVGMSKVDFHVRQILKLTFAYYILPSDFSKQVLEDTIVAVNRSSQLRSDKDLSLLTKHARAIISNKTMLDELLTSVVESNTDIRYKDVFRIYLQEYDKAEQASLIYSRILFAACILMFVFSIYSILCIWKSAQKLLIANQNLEKRVHDRTKALVETQAQVTKQQAILSASSKMSALGEMAGGVAHEINTPLAIIRMRAEQLEEDIAEGLMDTNQFMDSIEMIKNTTGRIGKIVNGLRFFAREGQTAPQEDVSVSSVIDDTLSFCSQKFKDHDIQISIRYGENAKDARIHCRSVEISQVLLNLLSNAHDAVQDLEEKWIRIETEIRDQCVEISVIDSGSGIPAEIQEKLMEPFFTTKPVGKGTGLGLSISRGIVEAHSGRLFIDQVCENTKFKLTLPKAS